MVDCSGMPRRYGTVGHKRNPNAIAQRRPVDPFSTAWHGIRRSSVDSAHNLQSIHAEIMNSFAAVLGFSWSYARRYWLRLAASLLFGLIFALANASFMWAARTLASRWELASAPETKPSSPTKTKSSEVIATLKAKVEQVGKQ